MHAPALAVPLLGLATAGLLAAGLVGVAVHGGGDAGGAPAVTAAVPALTAFVEQARGLRFLAPVRLAVLGDADFESRLGRPAGEDADEVRRAAAVLQAIGLVAPGTDLVAALDRSAAAAVLGFYDARSGELVVRGTSASPLVRTTLVHELVHALEDQHFGLDRPGLEDEAAAGFQALVEGSATVVEERYLATLPGRERRAARGAERARAARVPRGLPEPVEIALGFPYSFGPGLVRALLAAGGQARLDGAFARPPASTEQVLEPARYLSGDEPRPVARPAPDRPPFDQGQVGELYLILMLRAELPEDRAREAARGWGGDAYVAWRDGPRACVRMTFVTDTRRDAAELAGALADWAAARSATASASTASASGTTLRTCG